MKTSYVSNLIFIINYSQIYVKYRTNYPNIFTYSILGRLVLGWFYVSFCVLWKEGFGLTLRRQFTVGRMHGVSLITGYPKSGSNDVGDLYACLSRQKQ